MLRRRFYYAVKPFLPWGVRMGIRRMVARRQRVSSTDIWPIDPAAAAKPSGWPGWPQGKKFAVVLTHDVEGPDGLKRCRHLANLEMELGFRSSFNFIPEGSYRVSQDLRHELADQGFEVGVHDLEHNGRLFASQRGFQDKAIRINRYLRDWNAVGFRSGFMLRNLDWIHALDVQYDLSTFDTDPFEPQPDPARTIFPFWISAAPAAEGGDSRGGYVELPYTLAQDSTLFLLLQEETNAIWKAKVDWLAEQGGMVLLNVHPDYLHFTTDKAGRRVEDHYVDLLKYLSTKYANAFWHALPRDVSGFVREWRARQLCDGPVLP